MLLAPGTRLGPYEIIGPLGVGGMGEVHRARDSRLGRDVAIKSLPVAFARDSERLARFEREARLLASLSHPNIAGIHGLEEVDGARFLVLEFVEGESLASRLARGALPVDEAIAVARQVASGLEAAHESGVIHRDLKPANVMLTPSGQVKVLDFGLATSGSGVGAGSDLNLSSSPTMTQAVTQAGMILGTAAYMSPEQARGRAVDKRSDIWSFGCVLYECLTGRPLFEGETVSDLIACILQSELDWTALPASVPVAVRALLRRCLCRDPRERLRDIGEARIVLGSAMEPGAAEAPAVRRGIPWSIAASIALLLLAIALLAIFRFRQPTSSLPVRKFDLIARGMVVDWPITPTLAPDGSRFAYVSGSRIWVRDLDQLVPRAVAELLEDGPVAWSPDSRQVVYGDDKKIWKASIDGGSPIAVCQIPGTGKIIGSTWSAKGLIAFSVWRGAMYQVPAAGGTATTLVDVDPATQIDFHSPTWLRNGDLLYVTHFKSEMGPSRSNGDDLTIFDGKRQFAVHGNFGSSDATPLVTPTGELLYLMSGASPGIWVVPFDLKGRRITGSPALVAPGAATLSASDDGSLLYVEGSTGNVPRQLFWVDQTGRTVAAVGMPHLGLDHPRLSPDGRRVAFSAEESGNSDIWVLDLVSGAETRLTFGSQGESAPEWLGSSTRLAYNERGSADDLQGRILSINADGSGGQQQVAPMASVGWRDNCVKMLPDGRSALRLIDERGHGSLQVGSVGPDGVLGPLKPLFRESPEPNLYDATISPDGHLLACQTNDPGRVDIFLTRFPGGEGRWQIGSEGGFLPRWAFDGRKLFFLAGSGPSNRGMAVASVDPSLDPPLGAITRLFDFSNHADVSDFDVTNNGQFLFVRPTGGGESVEAHLVLVQNWRTGIKRQGHTAK